MFLKKLFQKTLRPKSSLPFSEKDMQAEIKRNRAALKMVNNWIDKEAFERSFFDYGIPGFHVEHINKEINTSLTYSDIILYIANNYLKDINYLEIGVSVGKNFFQVLMGVKEGRFYGYDIEEINPILKHKLIFKSKAEWETPDGSIKKSKSSLSQFDYDGKEVNYLSGDVWDVNSWQKLNGNKFNIIFSDALHTPEAILFEFEMLSKLKLLDEEKFVIIWDDLVGDMQKSFFKIIREYNRVYSIKETYLIKVNGWVGEHEDPHTVGIIANFTF